MCNNAQQLKHYSARSKNVVQMIYFEISFKLKKHKKVADNLDSIPFQEKIK